MTLRQIPVSTGGDGWGGGDGVGGGGYSLYEVGTPLATFICH